MGTPRGNKSYISLGLKYRRETGAAELRVLDQRLLHAEERWLSAEDPAQMGHLIQELAVRGAPMIGVCAALSLACEASRGANAEQLRASARMLREARPTAVNLAWAVDRLLALPVERWIEEAERIAAEDIALCEGMARNGAALVAQGERVLTHCNTGGLATVGVGTALGVLRRAHEQGKAISVWVDETRPLLQGGRLTAWELGRLGIPYRLVVDSAAGMLMARGEVDRVLVGADRIACNGDAANKIGTYSLAVLARHHGVPFHIVAPRSTVDRACPDGAAIPIEQRAPDEVRGPWAPPDAPVYNPAFDTTPAELITSWILDDAVLSSQDVAEGALRTIEP
ncbi:MAG TPA: S-methyl-5-thioribose-1-phosphate isomerase [Nocardioides bacterium]|nr:S-methyl-5-thioribose-1-phosphate isomerase [Nocardioides sp.]